MKQTYDVTVLIDASASVSVEAETPQQAAEWAEQIVAEKGAGDLCHQCSDHTDAGDFIGAHVHDASGEMVLDTSLAGDLEAKVTKLQADLDESARVVVNKNAECIRLRELASKYRDLLTAQRYPDNDYGDHCRRNRSIELARIDQVIGGTPC